MNMESSHRPDYAGKALAASARLREAIQGIINAANANPEPIHYKVREAIEKARKTIEGGGTP